MPNGGGNPEAVAEKAESPQAPFDDAWTDIQDSAAVDPELGRRYTMLYVAEHGGRTYHDYSAYLKTEDRAGLVDEIVGSLGPRGKAYKDVIAKTLTELGEGSAGVLPDPSRANTSAAAEPIVMFTGGFAHQSDDLHVNGAGIDFIFRRTYRNQSIFFGPMGAGWDHGYDLRLVEAGDVLRLKAGDLREHVYTRHPRFGQSGFDYFVPPDGQHSIVVTAGDSFASRGPDGLMHVFERSGLADVHRLARIEDRYGNQLRFSYRPEDGLLDRVLVNHPGRIVQFDYDPAGRVVAVGDYAGRVWRYRYDDFGDLVAVTTPPTDRYPSGLTTTYDYSTAETVGAAQHNLMRVFDPEGRLYLENDYGRDFGTIEFNRVTGQRMGAGESFLAYQNIDPTFEAGTRPSSARRTRRTSSTGTAARSTSSTTGSATCSSRRNTFARLGRSASSSGGTATTATASSRRPSVPRASSPNTSSAAPTSSSGTASRTRTRSPPTTRSPQRSVSPSAGSSPRCAAGATTGSPSSRSSERHGATSFRMSSARPTPPTSS